MLKKLLRAADKRRLTPINPVSSIGVHLRSSAAKPFSTTCLVDRFRRSLSMTIRRNNRFSATDEDGGTRVRFTRSRGLSFWSFSFAFWLRPFAAGFVFLMVSISVALFAQNAPPPGRGAVAAVSGAGQDPASVERGAKLFASNCAGCHGVAARGSAGAPDLVRSILVLDDEKGILIAPVIRNGRPDLGMPKSTLPDAAVADIVSWRARPDLERRTPIQL
jgi:mono/diheme cytochrome c family protein